MDTTKQNILMCEKAEEIQKGYELRFGDLSYSNELSIKGVRMERFHNPKQMKDGEIWLPRQGQLHLLSELSWQEFDWKCANEYPLAITKEGWLVLDNFLGSGTTAVACEKLGRRWIGIEISEKYCEISARRIESEARQGKLFFV